MGLWSVRFGVRIQYLNNNPTQITANLDVFIRRFNEIQYWIVTEIVLTPSLGKRVSLLRKFIKLAA